MKYTNTIENFGNIEKLDAMNSNSNSGNFNLISH